MSSPSSTATPSTLPNRQARTDSPSVRTDREYYAELWGTDPAARSRHALVDLRKRSAFVAAVAAAVLVAQFIVSTLAASAPDLHFEIGPAGDSTSEAPAAESPEPVVATEQRTSSMVNDVDADQP